jgi:phosphoenolpyruvate-protein kinase (PTS system EI component)
LFEANLKANINTGNQGWFYVFIRTARELEVIANIIRETGKKFGALPAEIGMMVEVPSNALIVEKLGGILKKLEKDGAQYGLKKIFFSFGTNDYTNLAGKTDREDPRI